MLRTVRADAIQVSQLIETRWTRYGKDRVYLRTADGADVGHVDLQARTVVAKAPGYETALEDCLARWASADEPVVPAQPIEPRTEPAPSAMKDAPKDFAKNAAGAAVRAKRDEVNSKAPVANLVARAFGVKTEERPWRDGAKGEEKVGRELARLGPVWRVLHAVEVGNRGSDIDHVVIGPPGVITLNTKRRPRGKAWVAERMVMVNGQRTDYLRNSRHEAQRAQRLLSVACCQPVAVKAVIVFVDLATITVKQMPEYVHVTTCRRLVRWLTSLPPTTSSDSVEQIFAKARFSTTWQ